MPSVEFSDALILGSVQGLTEFIPVSSTAHLFLTHELLGLSNDALSLAFDIVLHLGTVLAVLAVYWREILRMILELGRWIGRVPAKYPEERALILPIIIGTIPGALVGAFLLPMIVEVRSPRMIGLSMLVACSYFLIAESRTPKRKHDPAPTILDSVWIGLAQAAAGLMAGFSRSGFTITTGRLRGMDRAAAAKFSFLLSLPIILGAGAKAVLDLRAAPELPTSLELLGAGFAASALTGYVAVRFLLRFLRTHTLRPFAAYLGVLGGMLVLSSFLS